MQQALVGLQLVKMQQDLAVCSGYLKAFPGQQPPVVHDLLHHV